MKYIFVLFLVLISNIGFANDTPIEVTADNALEWNRAQMTFIATGNALISQDTTSINAPTITAKYSEGENGIVIESVTAKTNAVLKQPRETLTAETIEAFFKDGVLDEVVATRNVILKTDKETLYGDQATYNAIRRVIIVKGNVKIEQGDNILTGSQAEFDLNTNISTLSASPNVNNGRVKAIFQTKGGE